MGWLYTTFTSLLRDDILLSESLLANGFRPHFLALTYRAFGQQSSYCDLPLTTYYSWLAAARTATTITPTTSGHGLRIHDRPSWLLSRSSRGLRLLGTIGSNGNWDGQRLPQLGYIPTCPACGKLWEDTDDRWTHVLAGCSVVTDQLPSTLGWIQ